MKLLSLLMCCLLLFTVVACSDTGDTVTNDTTKAGDETTAEAVETQPSLYADLPKDDYDGYTFNIMTTESNYAIIEMNAESLDGDIINDSIYNRNRAVEAALNITITQDVKTYGDSTKAVVANVAAGDNVHDVIFTESNNSTALARDKLFIDLMTVPGFNFEKPWWDSGSVENFMINSKLYFVYGNLHLQYYEALYTIMFNKTLINNYDMENPYQLVNDGKWTIDKYVQMVTDITSDLNGDGAMNAQDDLYGTLVVDNQPIYYALCSGERFSRTNADGTIEFLGMHEQLDNVANKIKPILSNKEIHMTYSTPGVSAYPNTIYSAFESQHGLFMVEVMGRVKELRTMDTDFGLLPFPKYDEKQPEYMSGNAFSASLLSIPVTCDNLERTGTILENICAGSYEELIPAYYEINLKGKQFRDDDSEAMLNLMLNNIQYDLALIFNFGSFINMYNSTVTNNADLMSKYAAIEKAVNMDLQKTMDLFYN
jgi:ABC-type sugar transport system, periplasmic component